VTLCEGDESIMSRLRISKTIGSQEQQLDTMDAMIRSGAFDIVVLDSVAALTPRAMLEGQLVDEPRMALKASILSRAMGPMQDACAQANCAAIFINQVRTDPSARFTDPETTPGGWALKFFSSLRIHMELVGGKKGQILKDGKAIGGLSRVRLKKTRFGPMPFDSILIPIYYQGDPGVAEVAYDLARSGRYRIITSSKGNLRWGEMSGEDESSFRHAIIESDLLQTLCNQIIEKAKEKNYDVPKCILDCSAGVTNEVQEPKE
jgi:hypothetical protein